MRCAVPVLIMMIMSTTAGWPSSGWSQVANQRQSFIKPFPNGNVYRLQVIGDWFADGLRGSIAESMLEVGQVRTVPSVIKMRSLRRRNWDAVLTKMVSASTKQPIDIAVIMLGAAEFGSISVANSRRIRRGTAAWKKEYASRVNRIMKVLKDNNTAVYWLSVPTLRNERHDDHAQFINEILRERAYINGVKYIDTYAGFAAEDGGYDAYGPDMTGKISRLRLRDGIYFTNAGYQKLTHFAARVIARDIRQAISEREIPLAGSELEQSRINPAHDSEPAKQAPRQAGRAAGEQEQKARRLSSSTISAPSPVRQVPGLKDQKADHGSIVIKTVNHGIVQSDTVTIIRPAIPAALLSILARVNDAGKARMIGRNIHVELPDDVVLMHSLTPASQNSGFYRPGQFSPLQSPFFKVWAKGERLPPRSGRADDVEWPRPKPQPVRRLNAVTQSDITTPAIKISRPQLKYTPDGFPPLPKANPLMR